MRMGVIGILGAGESADDAQQPVEGKVMNIISRHSAVIFKYRNKKS